MHKSRKHATHGGRARAKHAQAPLVACLLAGLCLVLWYAPSEAVKGKETGEEYAFKITMEKHLEERLNTVLKEVSGIDGILAVVDADVESPGTEDDEDLQSRINKKLSLLPGVPARDEIAKTAANMAQRPPVVVKKMRVSIMVPQSTSTEQIDMLYNLALSLIDYNPERGDRVDVRKVDFDNTGFNWQSLLYPPNIYYIILVILGGGFLLAASFFFMNPFRSLSVSLKDINLGPINEQARSEAEAARQADPFGGAPAGMSKAFLPTAHAAASAASRNGGSAAMAKPFSFITEEQTGELTYLLKDRSASEMAIVINYLAPETATAILDTLGKDMQTDVALELSSIKVHDPAKVKALEEDIRERLNYVVGGTERLASILNFADEEVRDNVFERIEKADMDTADALRKHTVTFESIMRGAGPNTIQALIRLVSPKVFAPALNSSSGDVQSRVLEMLSAGAAERMQEEMRYSKPLTGGRLKREKAKIVNEYRRLLSAGLLEEEV